MKDKEQKIGRTSFSVYLLKPEWIEDAQSLFDNAAQLEGVVEGRFVGIPAERQVPKWFTALRPYLAQDRSAEIFSQSPAGMILIARGEKRFVVTFGHAWQRLEPHWLEPDFGRRVALNSIPPDEVIEINSEQVFAKWHISRERSPRATAVREFAIEHDRDLVAAVEGVPREAILGEVIRGSTSLRLSIPISSMRDALDYALKQFLSNEYRKHWPEIDNLMPIGEFRFIQELDTLLDADLVSGKAKKDAVLFSPSIRRGEIASADSYVFGRRSAGNAMAPYLMYGTWERYLATKGETPSVKSARTTPVHMLDEAGDVLESRSVYECLGYELNHQDASYVLSSGVWYRAADTFLKSTDRILRRVLPPAISLPDWDGAMSEGEYNNSCCTPKNGLLHFDAKIIPFGGGQSKFEFCDFLHPTKKILFFAKIASRSSDCSHLVEQVRRCSELLYSPDAGFRRRLKKAFEKHYPNEKRGWLDERPRPGDWQFCLVSLGRPLMRFPLFAKCGVARLVRALEQASHPVSFLAV